MNRIYNLYSANDIVCFRKNTQMSEKCPLFTHLCAFKRDASIPKIYIAMLWV